MLTLAAFALASALQQHPEAPRARDEEITIRLQALAAVVRRGQTQAIPQIVRMLDADPDLAPDALEALWVLDADLPIAKRLELLKHKSPVMRATAARQLGLLGLRDAAPDVATLLKDPDNDVRRAAVRAISHLQARDAVPALVALLDDEDENVRADAAWAVGAMRATEAVPALLRRLTASEHSAELLTALVQLGAKQAAPELVKHLGTNQNTWTLMRLGADEVVPQLMQLIKENGDHASEAAYLLVRVGTRDASLIDLLKKELPSNTRDHASRILRLTQARWAIPRLVPLLEDDPFGEAYSLLYEWMPTEIVPALISLLASEKAWVPSCHLLAKLRAKEAVPALEAALKSEGGPRRTLLLQTLGVLKAPDAVKPFLSSGIDREREFAARALGVAGARDSIPALQPLLADANPRVRSAAAEALGVLDARDARPAILKVLKEDGSYGAADAAGRLNVKDAIPFLTPLLKNDNSILQDVVVGSLRRLKAPCAVELAALLVVRPQNPAAIPDALVETGATAVPIITPLLTHEDYFVRIQAARILARIGARDAIPHLVQSTEDRNVRSHPDVADALVRLKAKEAIPELLARWKAQDGSDREYYESLLARLDAKEAVPVFIATLLPNADRASVRALGRLVQPKEVKDFPALVPALLKRVEMFGRHGDPRCREAGDAIASLEAHDAVDPLLKLLRDGDEMDIQWRRPVILRTLSTLRATEAIPDLIRRIRGWRDPDAINAVAHMGAQEAISSLKQLVLDGDPHAASALCRLGSRDGVELLLDSASHFEPLDALNALAEPELWAKWQRPALGRELVGLPRDWLEQMAAAAGTSFLGERSARNFLRSGEFWFGADAATMFEELRLALQDASCDVILTREGVRIVDRIDGLKHWQAWWRAQGGRK